MKKFLFLLAVPFTALAMIKSPVLDEPAPSTYVVISTEYGDIKCLLYDDTPLHKQNFIKNVRAGVYDSLLFHRVIQSFMIQGGDPDSKHAKPGDMLGNGGLDYTVPAEFKKHLFHKKGALAAARQGDDVNPSKASSSTQFYIVQGQVYDDATLLKMEARINQMTMNAVFYEVLNLPENADHKKRFTELQLKGDQKGMMEIFNELNEKVSKLYQEKGGDYVIPTDQKEVYKKIGGTPHLDGNYTVFGEVVSGMEVIEKIAAEKVDGYNRPEKDIRFSIKIEYK